METKRAIIAVVLSLLVLAVWTRYFTPENTSAPEKVAQENTQKEADKKEPTVAKEQETAAEKSGAVEREREAQGSIPVSSSNEIKNAKTIQVQTKVAIYRFTEVGGKLVSVKIVGMRETMAPDSELKELIKVTGEKGTLGLISRNQAIRGLENAVFTVKAGTENIDATRQETELVFRWVSDDGVEVLRKYTFSPDSFLFNMKVEIINHSNRVIDDNIGIVLNAKHDKNEGGRYAFSGYGIYADDKLEEFDKGDIEDGDGTIAGKISWGGYENSYFLQAVIPVNENGESMKGSMKAVVLQGKNDKKNPEFRITYLTRPLKIQPSDKIELLFKFYFGSKKIEILSDTGYMLDKSINMGWFDIIAKPFLYFLNFNYRMVGNFGLAIIILTLAVKLVFFPLTQKSYKSMRAMQALQPQMAKLREKYKGDKTRLNQEMMGLYKAHKVNPMGGCLPMVIQIPVFIALYRLLDYAIELRHTPFIFWIQDLSAPDRLFRFPFSIPFMEPPYGIPVLTLLMGASMFITQKMTPTPGDPTQAKIMLLMPIVFTFIFINFPSGLVLYWLTQNILSIAQQYWVNKQK